MGSLHFGLIHCSGEHSTGISNANMPWRNVFGDYSGQPDYRVFTNRDAGEYC